MKLKDVEAAERLSPKYYRATRWIAGFATGCLYAWSAPVRDHVFVVLVAGASALAILSFLDSVDGTDGDSP